MVQEKSVVVVDDHPLFREGLKAVVERDARFRVVGEAGNARDGLRTVQQLKPDLVVVDISLPDKTGLQLTREIRGLLPETRIMVLSVHSKMDYVAEAFQAGATGYVVKGSASERLLRGLESVSKGDYFLDSFISHEALGSLIKFPAKEARITDPGYEALTSREQEVLRLLAEGLTTREIAEKLFISTKTVENHRGNVMKKLDLHSTVELIRYAAKLGLIDVDQWKD